ncbi:hypothetical protein [Pinibacter soli]|uniref:Response regulator n=1 Tax=Pinibacter soli TaxID=3044211 RepID=A0ABT6RHE8_9BACT|nr:hypothetical protein [Pinibacter soli]MDI3321995.1 hypothetical protein [Pinibacter soli]
MNNLLQFKNPGKEIAFLYLDDESSALHNFQVKVNSYNTNVDNDDAFKIRLQTTDDNVEAVGILESENNDVDVFICDHNMPTRKGLDLIKYFKSGSANDLIYVLYTGAGNVNNEIRRECANNDILLFAKTEEFSTLIGQIVNKANKQSNNPMENLYFKLTSDMIRSLQNIANHDPSFRIQIGSRFLKPNELINELNNRTQLGFEYLESYIEGLKFFNR